LDEKEEVTEGAISNIMIEKAGMFYTPSIQSGILNGILRQKWLSNEGVIEKILFKEDL
jgi:para-aminobenzoate synthetase/4-amino-4-deoxychorismate lyase